MTKMPPIKVEYITPDGKPHVPQKAAAKGVEAPAVEEITVNGTIITAADIHTEVQHHPGDKPETVIMAAARALVVRELLRQEADVLALAAEPQTDSNGLRETEEDALIRALLEQEVSHPVANEQACQRYYDTHKRQFMSDTIYEARHILLPAAPDDQTALDLAKSEAEMLIQELQERPDRFAKLAKSHSACPSKEQGGNLGQLSKGSTVPEFEQALEKGKQGQLFTAPVASRFGYHVVQLDRIIAGQLLPFSVAQDKIAAWLEASSWSRGVSQYIGTLVGKADIQGIDLDGADSPLVQ